MDGWQTVFDELAIDDCAFEVIVYREFRRTLFVEFDNGNNDSLDSRSAVQFGGVCEYRYWSGNTEANDADATDEDDDDHKVVEFQDHELDEIEADKVGLEDHELDDLGGPQLRHILQTSDSPWLQSYKKLTNEAGDGLFHFLVPMTEAVLEIIAETCDRVEPASKPGSQ